LQEEGVMNRLDVERLVGADTVQSRATRRAIMRWGAAVGLSGPALAGLWSTADAHALLQDAADTGLLTAPEPNPQRGGTLRTAFGVTTSSYDIHQGGGSHVLTHLYDGLVRLNPLDGLRSIIPSGHAPAGRHRGMKNGCRILRVAAGSR
jgi:hypothetical protein